MLTLSIYRPKLAEWQKSPFPRLVFLVVAMDAFAALVAFLGFQAERGDRAGVEAGDADRLAGLLAVAVAAVLDPAQGLVDLGDQLPLAVTGAQLQGTIGLRRRPVGEVRMIFSFALQV